MTLNFGQSIFPKDTLVSNYNYLNTATGSAYLKLYAGDYSDANQLFDIPIYSCNGYTEVGTETALDIDFDLKITKQIIIKGNALVSFAVSHYNITGTQVNPSQTITYTAKIRKWDGSTETEIASETIDIGGEAIDASENKKYRKTKNVTIPKTKYSKDDSQKVSLISEATNANQKIYLAHDPKNRTTGITHGGTQNWTNTELLCLIPIQVVT